MTDGGKVRMLLADPHALFRHAVAAALEPDEDVDVVAEAGEGIQAVFAAERHRPDVALIAADVTDCDGVQAAALIRERVPGCKVILLGTDGDEALLTQAVYAGVNGYVTKESPLQDLVDAVRAVVRNETVIPPKMLGRLVALLVDRRRQQDVAIRKLRTLTRRERQVLSLLAEGADNDGIAEALVISPQTARTHIQNVLGKLGMHSRLEAAAFVIHNSVREELADFTREDAAAPVRRRRRADRRPSADRPLTGALS